MRPERGLGDAGGAAQAAGGRALRAAQRLHLLLRRGQLLLTHTHTHHIGHHRPIIFPVSTVAKELLSLVCHPVSANVEKNTFLNLVFGNVQIFPDQTCLT